jgi:hypothetical protein
MDTPRIVGAGPSMRALCEEIGQRHAINQVVPWDGQRRKLSPSERIQARVLNLLTARKLLDGVQEEFALTAPRCSGGLGSAPRTSSLTPSAGR